MDGFYYASWCKRKGERMQVTIIGTVSASTIPDEVATFTVTKPDGTTEVKTSTIGEDLIATVVFDEEVGTGYTVKGHVDSDGIYAAVDSNILPFDVAEGPEGLLPRTFELKMAEPRTLGVKRV
jgi:hypothetical protein